MTLQAFRCGANILAYEKNNQKYGMTCAWAMMVDFGKVMMLIGGQSETGNNLELNDIVGISALAEGQHKVAALFGMNHSSKVDKFESVDYSNEGGPIVIKGAKVQMIAKAIKIENLDGDYLITFEVMLHKENKDVNYLDGYDPKCYQK